MMKAFLKIFFCVMVAGAWFLMANEETKWLSGIFFLIMFFALFVQPFKKNEFALKEQYLQKLKEGAKKNQEINEQLSREKNITYKDLRKKDK